MVFSAACARRNTAAKQEVASGELMIHGFKRPNLLHGLRNNHGLGFVKRSRNCDRCQGEPGLAKNWFAGAGFIALLGAGAFALWRRCHKPTHDQICCGLEFPSAIRVGGLGCAAITVR